MESRERGIESAENMTEGEKKRKEERLIEMLKEEDRLPHETKNLYQGNQK